MFADGLDLLLTLQRIIGLMLEVEGDDAFKLAADELAPVVEDGLVGLGLHAILLYHLIFNSLAAENI